MSWTDERVEVLKKLWVDGLSASQIAKQLGGVTRNAVIGKVHRLGLAGRAAPSRPIKRIPRQRPVLVATPPVVEAVKVVAETKEAPVRPSIETRQAPVQHVHIEPKRNANGSLISVLELSQHMCKWPIGDPTDPDFGFCGAKSHGSWPYCQEHGAIAYQPQGMKRGERQELEQAQAALRKAM